MTARPLGRSRGLAGRIQRIACSNSPPPPHDLPTPHSPPEGEPLGLADGSEFAAEPAPPVACAADCASAGIPFKRAAICWAMGGGNLRICESPVIFTVMDFFKTKSWTVIVPADASSAEMGPAIF